MTNILNLEECKAAGFSEEEINEVRKIANGIARYSKRAESMGLAIFGGTNTLSLRFEDHSEEEGMLVIADVHDGNVSGGDGGTYPDSQGLLRGEGV